MLYSTLGDAHDSYFFCIVHYPVSGSHGEQIATEE